jgi:hypothetical protein
MKEVDVFYDLGTPSLRRLAAIDLHLLSSVPIDVVLASNLDIEEKRELLSSWASDARAVPSAPALRRLDNGVVVHIDGILDALKSLDLPDGGKTSFGDDDDDPPPCPAMLAPVPRLPPSATAVSLEAA